MKVALVQLDSDPDREPQASREAAAVRVGEAAADGARLVVLPELWLHGAFDAEPWPKTAEPLDGETAAAMRQTASVHGIVLHAGSIVERVPEGEFYNTSLVLGPEGQDLAVYRKIHRFGFDQGEAAFMSAGRDLVTFDVLDDAAGRLTRVGLATCYDLRFPEMFRKLVDAGVQTVIIPAAWPARRREHWRILLQARAIENQVYVLACVAVGTQAGLDMSGHSMVIDPWGAILVEGGEGEQIIHADIDLGLVDETRDRFPVLRDRRL
ncbi:MAG TPA: carbon-nitrogen family hydrolase [Actinocrinis sp.]|uniref:carbon-nitrogen family hydrolase n=1 Tax=Actinocrinis sp. TaxID=1920516 RepID=UPI002DDCB3F0|nr:carbon-nitrogen family hydrolase [Actinocrinis sp.]HEV3170171.1 carbon-nitrogen family hydrolase [Actinocrinis sp.]